MCGQPMIAHVMQRVRSAGFDAELLATSVTEIDGALASDVASRGYGVYLGSEWDVLRRMHEAATVARANVIVRVTGDCPLWAPDVGRAIVQRYLEEGDPQAIVTNDTNTSGWPDGLDVEVFSYGLLEQADWCAYRADDREHVTKWMRREGHHIVVPSEENWVGTKLSVDDAEQFAFVSSVMSRVDGYDWASTRKALQSLGERR